MILRDLAYLTAIIQNFTLSLGFHAAHPRRLCGAAAAGCAYRGEFRRYSPRPPGDAAAPAGGRENAAGADLWSHFRAASARVLRAPGRAHPAHFAPRKARAA